MNRQNTDILISGGGVAGLVAAAAFGQAGFSVVCVEPTPPVTDGNAVDSDQRSTAFMQPGVDLLDRAGLWQKLAPHATPLQVMRIVDAGGPLPEVRVQHDFDASDISSAAFGQNLPNWLLRRELVAHLAALPTIRFMPGVATASVLGRESAALVGLSNGERFSTRLLIAADGRNSMIREAMNIGVQTVRYGQKALSFSVTHPIPHHNITTEIHRSGGPFTLVPLQDRDGLSASAVVWMEKGEEIARLVSLDARAFEAEMAIRSCGLFGTLTLASTRTVWPMISQIADRLNGPRTALIAEAAHVVPPIGAQGLNMSLADITTLLEQALAAPADLGSEAMLASYHRRRWPAIKLRIAGIDILNRVSMVETQGLRNIRATALDALYRLKPLRQAVMRKGMGAGVRESWTGTHD